MSIKDIVRAWKDRNYRESLSEEQLAQLPSNPVGYVELTEADLSEIAGGQQNTLLDCGTNQTEAVLICGTGDWTIC